MSSKNSVFREPELTLCSALLETTQQGESEAAELKEKHHILSSVQDTLSTIGKSFDTISSNIKLKKQQINGITNEIEQAHRQKERLQTEIQVIQMENIKLSNSIKEHLKSSHFLLAWYDTYHNKMERFKMSISATESQAIIYTELMRKMEIVKRLKEHREELKVDLQNPKGNAKIQQKEIDNFKAQIHNARELVRRKEILLKTEKTNHSQLRNDIAIYTRRSEAIVKQLCCQLSKAQSSHEELSSDIFHTEKEVEHLKKQLVALHDLE